MELNFKDIFNLPSRCYLDKRLTKVFFTKNFDLNPSEKKVLNSEVLRMDWVGSIKPSNSNIPKFESEKYVFEEIQLMTCLVNQIDKNWKTIIDLFQKYIPYQIILIIEDDTKWMMNLSDKRINQNDRSKRTIERYYSTSLIEKKENSQLIGGFFKTMSFDYLNKMDLKTVYQSFINSVVKLKSSQITGVFQDGNNNTEEQLVIIQRIEEIEFEMISLKNQIKKESQLNNKVPLNIEIQKLKTEKNQLRQTLSQ